ncbi:DNA polymerase epsilon catalytic subunit A [Symbiodinium microadriaticum]|uniref:DNA polymerase epsilon catalytic subunit n=1 Tax=Symbiodinium microadriaticum TaxID=2951 RepID=A0A1Q9E3U6_SYMMI|nr:DNA polymerase epsilon catalytic subunit A [Symbiodinium microadriaticum]
MLEFMRHRCFALGDAEWDTPQRPTAIAEHEAGDSPQEWRQHWTHTLRLDVNWSFAFFVHPGLWETVCTEHNPPPKPPGDEVTVSASAQEAPAQITNSCETYVANVQKYDAERFSLCLFQAVLGERSRYPSCFYASWLFKDFGATSLRSAAQRLRWAFSTLEPPDTPEVGISSYISVTAETKQEKAEQQELLSVVIRGQLNFDKPRSISHGAIIGDFWAIDGFMFGGLAFAQGMFEFMDTPLPKRSPAALIDMPKIPETHEAFLVGARLAVEAAVRCAAALPATVGAELFGCHPREATSTSDVQRAYKVEAGRFRAGHGHRVVNIAIIITISIIIIIISIIIIFIFIFIIIIIIIIIMNMNKMIIIITYRRSAGGPERAVAARTKEELLRSKSKVRGDPPVARTIRQAELQSVVGLLSMLRRETAALRTTGHMELDADLLEVLDGILGNYLPNAWRRPEIETLALALALTSLCLHGHLMFGHAYSSLTCIGKFPSVRFGPRGYLSLATLRAAARVQELPLEAELGIQRYQLKLSRFLNDSVFKFLQVDFIESFATGVEVDEGNAEATIEVISRVEEEEDVQDFVAVQGSSLVTARADARMDEYLTHMPAIQFIPVRDHAFVLRLFQIAAALPRARGQAEDPNFIAQVFLRSANEPDEWLLKLSTSLGLIVDVAHEHMENLLPRVGTPCEKTYLDESCDKLLAQGTHDHEHFPSGATAADGRAKDAPLPDSVSFDSPNKPKGDWSASDELEELYEHDVPYVNRVCIDNKINVGKWYEVYRNPMVTSVEDLYDTQSKVKELDMPLGRGFGAAQQKKPGLRIFAWDIETTKEPLKFPDSARDKITMISIMVAAYNMDWAEEASLVLHDLEPKAHVATASLAATRRPGMASAAVNSDGADAGDEEEESETGFRCRAVASDVIDEGAVWFGYVDADVYKPVNP